MLSFGQRLSCGQIYPLRKGAWENEQIFLKNLFYIREREREFEFTLGNGCKTAGAMLILLSCDLLGF